MRKTGFLINLRKLVTHLHLSIQSYDLSRTKTKTLIPYWFFKEELFNVKIQIPYCPKNEQLTYKLIKHLESFTNNNVKFEITWKTRKVKSLFPLKNKVTHKSVVIYEGTCSYGGKYIGETKRNAQVRWTEHDKMQGKSEPARHVLENEGHSFTWKVLCNASLNNKKRKILEAFYIMKYKPTIHDQLDIKFIRLFKNGVT